MQEAHHAQPVGNGNYDDIRILLDEIEAVEHRIYSTARLKGSAVNPYHDRLLLSRSIVRLKYIQIQAVFIQIVHGPHFKTLVAIGTLRIIVGLIDAIIRGDIHRCLPALTADRLLAYIRDASVGDDILLLPAYEGSVNTLHGKRLIIVAVGNFLVLAAVHGVQRVSNVFQFHSLMFIWLVVGISNRADSRFHGNWQVRMADRRSGIVWFTKIPQFPHICFAANTCTADFADFVIIFVDFKDLGLYCSSRFSRSAPCAAGKQG